MPQESAVNVFIDRNCHPRDSFPNQITKYLLDCYTEANRNFSRELKVQQFFSSHFSGYAVIEIGYIVHARYYIQFILCSR